MKIELKKINISLAHSEETILFNAEIYVDGVYAGYAKNDGRGGSTFYHAAEGKRDLIAQAEKHCLSLPPIKFPADFDVEAFEIDCNLEHFIDELISNEIRKKEEKKLERKMEKCIMFGNESRIGNYTEVSFKVPLAQIPLNVLQNTVDEYKAKMPQGKVFWNTNFEKLGIKI